MRGCFAARPADRTQGAAHAPTVGGAAVTAPASLAWDVTSGTDQNMTLRSPIFRKLLWSTFVPAAITLLVLDAYLTRYVARREVESVEHRLSLEAEILAGEVADLPAARLQAWAQEAGARADSRITVITPQGTVLADSQHDPETMENHAHRPEIERAYQGQTGFSIRHSRTLNRDLCYVALPLRYQGQPGSVLRLAVPLEHLDAAIFDVRKRIFGASLVAAGLALAIAYLFSRSFTHRVSRLRRFAEGLVDQRFAQEPVPDSEDELGALARSLNRTALQLREMVDALSLESTRREAILASMVEGVLAVDSELRITFWNDSLARLLGAPTPIAQGASLLELVRDPGLIQVLSQALTSGKSEKRRLQFAGLGGADGRWFEVLAGPLAGPSRTGALAVLHDITDLERLERVRKDFVANVSHELRTPLTAIRGYAETLLEGGLEDRENNRRFAEIIKAHAIRLTHIATDLLVLSELESGRPPAPAERISICDALETALSSVEAEAQLRDVKLIRGNLEEAEVMGERTRLEQALVNLVDNAVKFNRPGGEVRVECSRILDRKARIVIADTGIGIPSQDIPRIFERFYRVDKVRSREVGGTGLGLSIVKHIVDRMNGTVMVESQLGKGSKFTVLLPAC